MNDNGCTENCSSSGSCCSASINSTITRFPRARFTQPRRVILVAVAFVLAVATSGFVCPLLLRATVFSLGTAALVVALFVVISLALQTLGRADRLGQEGWFILSVALVGAVAGLVICPQWSFPSPAFSDMTAPAPGPVRLFSGLSWGQPHPVFELHATAANSARSPVGSPWRVEAGLGGEPGLQAGGKWVFLLTTPDWAVLEHGRVRADGDGVQLRCLAQGPQGLEVIWERRFNPFQDASDRRWTEAEAPIPPRTDRLILEVLPGPDGNLNMDRIWVTPGRLVPPLGPVPAHSYIQAIPVLQAASVMTLLLLLFAPLSPLLTLAARLWPSWADLGPAQVETRASKILGWRGLAAAAFLVMSIGTLAVAWLTAPWLGVQAVPVRLDMTAPANAKISIVWRSGEPPLRVVSRAGLDGGELANQWLALLPPSPSYDLELVLNSPVHEAHLQTLTLLDSRDPSRPFWRFDFADPESHVRTQGLTATPNAAGLVLSGQTGGKLTLPRSVVCSPSGGWRQVSGLWGLFLGLLGLCAVVGWGLCRSPACVPERSVPAFSLRGAWPVGAAFIVASTIHLVATLNLPALVATDSRTYFLQALGLVDVGTFTAGGLAYEINRLPGYSLLLAVLLRASRFSVDFVAAGQASLFCVSVLMLVLALRRWLHPVVASAAVFLGILGLPQLWASRSILTESAFLSLVLISLAAAFMHFQAKERQAVVWLLVYGVLVTLAVFIRPNGILLLPALGLVCLGRLVGVVRQGRSATARLSLAARFLLPYAIVIVIPGALLATWSWRNYQRFGFVGPTDMKGVADVCGLIGAGIFDSRALSQPDVYEAFVRGQAEQGYHYHGWYLREFLFQKCMDQEGPEQARILTRLDHQLAAIARASQVHTPWQLNLTGWLRTLYWATCLPSNFDYSRRENSASWVDCDVASRKSLIADVDPRLNYEPRASQRIAGFLCWFDIRYRWWHWAVASLATGSVLWLLWRGYPLLVLPWLLFVLNLGLNVWLMNTRPRYVQILEPLLVIQVSIAVSIWLAHFLSGEHQEGKGTQGTRVP